MFKKEKRNDERTFLKGKKALNQFVKESEFIYEAVTTTLGAGGRNVLIKDGFNPIEIQKDGVSVAQMVSTIRDMDAGAIAIRDAAIKTNTECGDGTTTTVELAYNILKEGAKVINKGANPVKVKKGIEEAVKDVTALLDEYKEICEDSDTMNKIAMVSSNNDSVVSELVVKAYEGVGKNGMVYIQKNNTSESELEIDGGIVLDKGWQAPIYSTAGKPTIYNDCLILMVDDFLDKVDYLPYYIRYMTMVERKPLLVVISKMGHNVDAFFQSNRKEGAPIAVVYSALFNEQKSQLMTDLAAITGGDVLKDKNANIATVGVKGNSDEERIMSCGKVLGRANKVIISQDKTVIFPEPTKAAQDYIDAIDINDFWNEERLAIISGKLATIKLGANSEIELEERFTRLEDAVHSVKNAMRHGVVIGAGMALYIISKELRYSLPSRTFNDRSKDLFKGYNLLLDILPKVAIKIVRNAGFDDKIVDNAYKNGKVFNVYTEKYEPLSESVIIDPVKTVKQSLINAASVSSTLLTTEIYTKFG